MKDEVKFWKRLSIILIVVLIAITSISWSNYSIGEATLSDVCDELNDIERAIDRLASSVNSIYFEL